MYHGLYSHRTTGTGGPGPGTGPGTGITGIEHFDSSRRAPVGCARRDRPRRAMWSKIQQCCCVLAGIGLLAFIAFDDRVLLLIRLSATRWVLSVPVRVLPDGVQVTRNHRDYR